MHQFKVQIFTKTHGVLETIIPAQYSGQARMQAQEQYPDAIIGCVQQID